MYLDASLIDQQNQHPWESYAASIQAEYLQCVDEGLDIEPYAQVFQAVAALPGGPVKDELCDALYRAVSTCGLRRDWPYTEPDALEDIRAQRPDATLRLTPPPVDSALADRVLAAWYGRVAGCLLGRPVEGRGFQVVDRLSRACGNFPIRRYFVREDLKALSAEEAQSLDTPIAAFADTFDGAGIADDDINYTVMNAFFVVERHGRDFTPADIARAWMEAQPKTAYCTAERRAYRNFMLGVMPPHSASYKNPDRELIGAQIRADYYGYINPGDPEAAAAMAWRDASISHVKNGIYGSMWAAACIAAAAVCTSPEEVLRAGLEQIPRQCRLAECLAQVLAWHDQGLTAWDCLANIRSRYAESSEYCWVHTLPNAMIVAVALLYGEGDFTRAIGLAVGAGYDTDCNGATVGSIMGMMLGMQGIGEQWLLPLCGKARTQILGHDCVRLADMADMTLRHIRMGRA
ncbi:MAG: ADP-ribosylglycohydrolase family protein [Aristaeellaceae bacterium]